MTVTGTDAYGTYVDTGVGVAPTPRANVEIEFHVVPPESDTGSKNTIAQTTASHVGHRPANSPR
jgi:hypothetical protein